MFGVVGWGLTLLAAMIAWVFFRAESLAGAWRILQGMAGATASTDVHPLLWNAGLQPSAGALWCLCLGALACLGPNSNFVGTKIRAAAQSSTRICGLLGGAAGAAVLLLVVINTARDSVSAFIYFNF